MIGNFSFRLCCLVALMVFSELLPQVSNENPQYLRTYSKNSFVFFQSCNAKTSRVRTNYKLRVGSHPLKIGRYTDYSQVRIPYTGKYRTEDGERYYRHAKGARITKASHFDFEYQLGRKIVFLCVARGKPRPDIVWFKDGVELHQHKFLHISEYYRGKNGIKSKMEIDPATQGDAGTYECHAHNKWSIDMRSFRTDYTTDYD